MLVELAIVIPILLMLAFGTVDVGAALNERVAIANAVRGGARFASTHPTSWSPADPAPPDTIEGQVQDEGSGLSLRNSDADLRIEYFGTTGAVEAKCGEYRPSGGGFRSVGSVPQSTCTGAGSLVRVTAVHTFVPPAPLVVSASLRLTETATMVITP